MADINAYLREAINGPAPQHKVAGRNQFEISEGSDGATHTKIVDVDGNPLNSVPVEDEAVKAELEEIKATQAEILDRLDGTFDTRLTVSNMLLAIHENITDNESYLYVGQDGAGSVRYSTPPIKKKTKDISVFVKNDSDKDIMFFRYLYRDSPSSPHSERNKLG